MRFEWKYSWNSYLFFEQKDNRPNEITEVTDQKKKTLVAQYTNQIDILDVL